MSIRLFDGIGPVLDFMALRTAGKVTEAMSRGAEDIEMYAKLTAPWADRTGAARGGLSASVFEEGGEVVIELAHTVDYGLWLELIQDGRFAVIMPTLEAMGPKVIREAGGRVLDVGGF